MTAKGKTPGTKGQKRPPAASKAASSGNGQKALLDELFQAAIKLRGAIEPPDYKRYVLPIIFRHVIGALVHAAHGSVFDTITTSSFDSARLLLPPAGTLTEFEGLVRPLFLRILSSSDESRALASLRDALLPKLLSGEIRVKDEERMVGAIL